MTILHTLGAVLFAALGWAWFRYGAALICAVFGGPCG